MYRPSYFHGGYAVHGITAVPAYPKPRTLTTRACSVMYPAQNSIHGSGGGTAIAGAITRGPVVTAMSARG